MVDTVPRDPEITHKFVKLQTGRHFWNLSYLLERGRVIVFMVQVGGVIVFVVEYGGMIVIIYKGKGLLETTLRMIYNTIFTFHHKGLYFMYPHAESFIYSCVYLFTYWV